MCRCVLVSVERKYSTLIYLLLSFSLIFKWQISTRNIGWYLLTTKKKFILLIISGASFKKINTHKNMKLRLTLQSTCLIKMCLVKKRVGLVFKEILYLFSHQNIVGTSHSWSQVLLLFIYLSESYIFLKNKTKDINCSYVS